MLKCGGGDFGFPGPGKSLLESLSALAPVLIGVEHDGVPTTFQTTYRRNLTGDTRVFSGLVVQGGSRKRVGRVKDEKNDRVISTPAPAIPVPHVSDHHLPKLVVREVFPCSRETTPTIWRSCGSRMWYLRSTRKRIGVSTQMIANVDSSVRRFGRPLPVIMYAISEMLTSTKMGATRNRYVNKCGI